MGITIRRTAATNVTFTQPQQVIISDADDSIRVGDGSGNYAGVASNSLRVNLRDTSGDPIGEDSTIPLVVALTTGPWSVSENDFRRGYLQKNTTAAADLIAAPGSGIRLYITSIFASNSDTTSGSLAQFYDGATVVASFFLAPAGGGVAVTLSSPIRVTSNTAFRVSQSTTTLNFYSAFGYVSAS